MKNQLFTLNRLNRILWVLFWVFMLSRAMAAELVFEPATPIVEVGQQLPLSVSGTSGEITWNPTKGQIQGTGNQVTYLAPADAGVAAVVVVDGAGNVGTVKIIVTPKSLVSLENAVWKIFTNRDDVRALALSEDQATLWVGTNGGLEKRNASTGKSDRVYTKADGLPDNSIHALLSDEQGGIWIGTEKGGLAYLKPDDSWQVFNKDNSNLPYNGINAILSDEQGGVWIGTKSNDGDGDVGLAHFKVDGSWQIFNKNNLFLLSSDVNAILSDEQGGIWIGTGNGLANFKADDSALIFVAANSNLPSDNVNTLLSDEQGGVWVGTSKTNTDTDDGGLAHFKADGSWEVFNKDNSNLPSNDVNVLLSDEQGGVWVGTDDGGFAHLKADGSWLVFNTDNSDMLSNNVNTLLSDEQGGVWVGTENEGIAHFKADSSWQILIREHSNLPSNNVNALLSDAQGGIWVGARGSFAYFKADGFWQLFKIPVYLTAVKKMLLEKLLTQLQIVQTEILRLIKANVENNINLSFELFKTNKYNLRGLTETNNARLHMLQSYRADIAYRIMLFQNLVRDTRTLQSDDQGGVWVGTGSGLANLKADGSWQVFNTDNSNLPSDNVNTLLSDEQGGVWVGTSKTNTDTDDGGLAHFKADGSWEVFNKDNSNLPSNDVNVLLSDEQGGVWVGTDDGGFAHLKADGSWLVFNTDNSNLPSNDVNALLSDEQGGIWIGTDGGLANLKPENSWKIFNEDNSNLPDNSIDVLVSDEQGGIWVGTYDGGLAHLKADGFWQVFNEDNSNLPDNSINTLVSDGQRGIWIGTNDGLANLTFTQKNILCTDLNDAECQNVLTDKRAAILIHPRGQGTGYNQDVSIEFMANHAYRVLQNRGYDNDEIYFLSHKPDVDINGDGMTDRNVVDGPITAFDLVAGTPSRDLTRADVQQAFDWAKQKGKLDQPLVLIFVDHALTGKLRLDPFEEVLTAQDLNAMLTDYQQTTGSQVVVVLEACHTGSLVSGLTGPNRLIITSTAEDKAYYDNLGMFSFSKFFFDNLRRGESFYDAFQTVSDNLTTYGHPFDLQTPQLDDDGDGFANTSTDGRLARTLCLNGCFGALSGEITLEPETPAATVTAGQTLSLIVRAGITEGRIKRVWALIMTPDAAKQRNEQGFSLIPTPVVNLRQQPEDASRWQGSFNGFQYRGDYVITFMAEDNEGFITAAVPVVMTQPEGPEVPVTETEIKIYPAPTPNQTLYHDGDSLRVTLPPLPAEQVQYVGRSLPDGTLFLLSNLNGFVTLDAANIPVFQGGEVAIEMPVSADMPRGEYILYLLRIPVGVDLLSHPEQWMVGVSAFKVE